MEKIKSKRGFASMSPEKRAAIASMGGKAVKPENRAFSKNRTLASSAGKKGGVSVRPDRRSFSTDRKLASDAGKKGGSKTQKV
jgi:general stress protein YciG